MKLWKLCDWCWRSPIHPWSTINKYFIIAKYFCLLLLNRWILLLPFLLNFVSFELTSSPCWIYALSVWVFKCICEICSSCFLVLSFGRHGDVVQHHRDWPIEKCRVWKCFASTDKQKMLFALRRFLVVAKRKSLHRVISNARYGVCIK